MHANERGVAKLCGAAAIIFGVALVALAIANRDTAAKGGLDLGVLGPVGLAFFVTGALSWKQHRLATALLVLFAAAVGIWLVVGSTLSVPFPWSLINIGVGSLLVWPAIHLGRAWWRHGEGRS